MSERALRKYAEALLLDPEGWENATIVADDMGQYCMYCSWYSSRMLVKPVHDLDCYARKLQEALVDDPDVVGLLRWLVGQTLLPNCTAASAWIFNFVAERIREEFHVCLIDEPPGWEWV